MGGANGVCSLLGDADGLAPPADGPPREGLVSTAATEGERGEPSGDDPAPPRRGGGEAGTRRHVAPSARAREGLPSSKTAVPSNTTPEEPRLLAKRPGARASMLANTAAVAATRAARPGLCRRSEV